MDIYELQKKLNELMQLTRLIGEYGAKYAQAEHDYKVEVSKEVMKLKDKQTPSTLINLIIYGQPSVARIRLERDLAEVMYESSKEKINALKLYIRVIENQLQMEYHDKV